MLSITVELCPSPAQRYPRIYLRLGLMETVRNVERIAMYRPLTDAIPTNRDILLIDGDSSVDDALPRFERSPCPAYSVCRGLKESYRLLTRDDDRSQQVENFV